MGKTYRFNPARKGLAKGCSLEEVERSLRGKINRRKEARIKREEARQAIKEEIWAGTNMN